MFTSINLRRGVSLFDGPGDKVIGIKVIKWLLEHRETPELDCGLPPTRLVILPCRLLMVSYISLSRAHQKGKVRSTPLLGPAAAGALGSGKRAFSGSGEGSHPAPSPAGFCFF